MRSPTSGGGWQAVFYALAKAREAGGFVKLWRAMRSKNACKTCALGMGGQLGGMVNEARRFPEVCKKSLQAMVADMQGGIRPEFWSTYNVEQLRAFSPRELESCGRLTQPVIYQYGSDHYRAISWDDVLLRIAAKLRDTPPRQSFWYSSGRSSNEAAFLLSLFARVYGTNNVNNCSYFCHQASGVGLASSVGTGTATISLDDLLGADLVFLIGANPASNHPRLMRSLVEIRRRGGGVIVINPVIELGLQKFRVPSDWRSLLFGSRIASRNVQPDVGGDLALLTGVAKRIVALAAHDVPFLDMHCDGWAEYQAWLAELSWDEIVAKCSVDQSQIDEIATQYAAAKNVVFAWTMGVTHHAHGVHNVQAIANLALLRGMVGRPSAGLLPIRGHSNVQGIGTVGVVPKLKEALFDRMEKRFGITLPREAGLDTLGCIHAAHVGELRVGICLGGNLYGSNPDAAFAAAALQNLDLVVYLNTTLNTGHAHGLARETIILPVLARDEEPQSTTQESMFNYVRLSDGGPRRHAGPRSEVDIVASLAEAVLGSQPVNWNELRSHGTIRTAIADVVPGLEKIGRLDQTKEEFHVTGRRLVEPIFPTASGRAKLHTFELPAQSTENGELRLMTVRSEGQFNTVVYEDYDLYRGQDRRDVILLHPHDLARLGIAHDQRVSVTSAVGAMSVVARAFDRIKPGNALMYYPEANALVPRLADALSRTPAFKSVAVRVQKKAPVAADSPAGAVS
jgi:molybdopterin-dependent oxidoreductase alpha subunit